VIDDVLFLREESLILKPVIVKSENEVEKEVVETIESSKPIDDMKNSYGTNEEDDMLAQLAKRGIVPEGRGVE